MLYICRDYRDCPDTLQEFKQKDDGFRYCLIVTLSARSLNLFKLI